ncbi:fungal-specific transcription factor domain-containing protein [Aspergillus cavernicola]|uniref:Fungal-specific transcription factor domain-containing protein n=1 Tax=Aspergillus cavernicola TaxID=176166 RepID=A0ABR4IZT3_9EURO
MGESGSNKSQENVPHDTLPPKAKRPRRTRSRIACDRCHAQHARCDRVFPCSRCVVQGIRCDFTRALRKRGRIPKQDSPGWARLEGIDSPPSMESGSSDGQSTTSSAVLGVQTPERSQKSLFSLGDMTLFSSPGVDDPSSLQSTEWPTQEVGTEVDVMELLFAQNLPLPLNGVFEGTGLHGDPSSLELLNSADFAGHGAFAVPGMGAQSAPGPKEPISTLRYPVLQPLMSFVESTLSQGLACGLLDLYFTSAFPTHMHPVCHHIHCYVLRKTSFLSEKNPRPSSPALLASMLWVAALDDRALSLPISPRYRKKICHFLSSLTIQLLKPLTYTPPVERDESLNNFESFSSFAHHSYATNDNQDLRGSTGSLDDAITYIHIASIISASEQKAASMRWWYAAFSLAKELKLNREIEAIPGINSQEENQSAPVEGFLDYSASAQQILNCVCSQSHGSTLPVIEEQREERRRVWWLLYIMDRQLALCYNRPLILLDSESKALLLPLEEEEWQAGRIHSNSPNFNGPQCLAAGHKNMRRIFPDLTFHDHSIFGFFLPLMVILGQLVDLNQIKNHPLIGAGILGKEAWNAQFHEVLRQLDVYEASLNAYTTAATELGTSTPSEPSQPTTNPSVSQTNWLTQMVRSYALYYVHVLHILLNGKWDPVSLIEDKDFWTSSPSFASTVSHALSAAGAVKQILKFDPDVSFMPDFFGIQLLQGSFYFLLMVERLQEKAGEAFLGACEIMIRATESCIVTLNTEYQRNFCRIMRSAVAQARGRPVNHAEIRRRHRAVLALYRWTGTGTGLAL